MLHIHVAKWDLHACLEKHLHTLLSLSHYTSCEIPILQTLQVTLQFRKYNYFFYLKLEAVIHQILTVLATTVGKHFIRNKLGITQSRSMLLSPLHLSKTLFEVVT